MTRPVRVLSVDDHALVSEGIEARIRLDPRLEFAGALTSGETLVREVKRVGPDVVLLDIEMPGPDPFELIGDLGRYSPDVRVIVFSAHVRDSYIDAAVAAGAWGYLCKGDTPEVVVDALANVIQMAEFVLSPKVLQRCGPAHKSQPTLSKIETLSLREQQILRMIGRGLSRIEIADQVSRSPKTIDNHRASIMKKLGIRSSVGLARFAIREGLTEA